VQVVVTLTLKKEAGHYCDISLCIVYTTTQHQFPRDYSLNSHRSQDMRSISVCFRLSRLRSSGEKARLARRGVTRATGTGHVARMVEQGSAYTALAETSEGKKPLGRRKQRQRIILKRALKKRMGENNRFSVSIRRAGIVQAV